MSRRRPAIIAASATAALVMVLGACDDADDDGGTREPPATSADVGAGDGSAPGSVTSGTAGAGTDPYGSVTTLAPGDTGETPPEGLVEDPAR